jgi:hypothetical protein
VVHDKKTKKKKKQTNKKKRLNPKQYNKKAAVPELVVNVRFSFGINLNGTRLINTKHNFKLPKKLDMKIYQIQLTNSEICSKIILPGRLRYNYHIIGITRQ